MLDCVFFWGGGEGCVDLVCEGVGIWSGRGVLVRGAEKKFYEKMRFNVVEYGAVFFFRNH